MLGGISIVVVSALCVCLVCTDVHAFLWPNETDCPPEAFTVVRFNGSEGDTVAGESENGTGECPCLTRACLSMCDMAMFQSSKANHLAVTNTSGIHFPIVHDPVTLEARSGGLRIEDFHVVTWDPCHGGQKYRLEPEEMPDDEFKFLANGSIYLTLTGGIVNFTDYCFGAMHGDSYHVVRCFDEVNYDDETGAKADHIAVVAFPVGLLLSVPFLFVTFVIYSVIPELRNMHGITLRGYVGPLVVAYSVLAFVQMIPQKKITDSQCIFMAFVIHFSFLASFFWLNVMCFDIWWTFGGFRSLQGSVKQRERKKFIIYSIYAWGSATLLTGVCLIMDFVPSVPRSFIRPEFGVGSCWFTTDAARALYFYGPMGVTVICNICLFISTALKIIQHKKDTAHHLKGMDSRRHDDNKQWFNLYLKLFIVMGINWSMEIISWLCKDTPQYVWYITDLANTLQGLIIFIIFVWKDKIKRLLLKRLGCQDKSFQSRNSTRSAYHSSASRTLTTTAVMAPLQEKINPYAERTKTTTDESDCV